MAEIVKKATRDGYGQALCDLAEVKSDFDRFLPLKLLSGNPVA